MARGTILLPAGVVPPPANLMSVPERPPFDREFFERFLPEAAIAFCERAGCDSVIVELMTTDGATHLVRGISAVHDQWVAVQVASPKHRHEVDSFIPYRAIYGVEIHPRFARQPRRLGFIARIAAESRDSPLLESGSTPPAEPS